LSAVHNDNDIGLYVNSAKAITNGRKYTLLENSYTPPPVYDFKKDANGARAFRHVWLNQYWLWLAFSLL